jgi:hypothetical protein
VRAGSGNVRAQACHKLERRRQPWTPPVLAATPRNVSASLQGKAPSANFSAADGARPSPHRGHRRGHHRGRQDGVGTADIPPGQQGHVFADKQLTDGRAGVADGVDADALPGHVLRPTTTSHDKLPAGGARHRSRGSRGGRQGQLARSERVHRQRAGAQHAPRRRGRRTGARRTARVRKAAGGGDGRRAAVGRATAVGASAARAQAAGVRARDAARAQAATGEADDRGVSHAHREGGSFKWRGGAAGGEALRGWRGARGVARAGAAAEGVGGGGAGGGAC